ncbi:unnamed protein product [Clavelina lepadiformis]|uniref:Uncharacterized protein n=1 Tax=Clavelina lepadiformis TaxID=159417 RepID=A0ABP0GZ75_CLALP
MEPKTSEFRSEPESTSLFPDDEMLATTSCLGLTMKSSPVIYLPTKTVNNSDISGHLAAPVYKTAQCSSIEIPDFSMPGSMPNSSDGCISLDNISACSMTLGKRKFVHDDDGFPNLSDLKSFYTNFLSQVEMFQKCFKSSK